MADIPQDDSTSARVSPGGSIASTIDFAGDFDAFRVGLIAGFVYTFDLVGADGGGGTLSDPVLDFFDPEFQFIAESDDVVGKDSRLLFTASVTGDHFLSASGFGGALGGYTLSVSAPVSGGGFGADIPGDRSGTTSIAPGGALTSDIGFTFDVDVVRIELEAGAAYTFGVTGAGADPLVDPFLQLFDAGGGILAESDDAVGLDPRISFVSPVDGTFFLSVSAFDDGTGSYRLTASTATPGPADDEGGRLRLGQAATGTLDFEGDTDRFAVTLERGHTYRFALDGAGLDDPFLTLLDRSGAVVALDDDSGPGASSLIEFTAARNGRHVLIAGAGDDGVGAYRIRAVEIDGASPDPVRGFTAGADIRAGTRGDDQMRSLGGNDKLRGLGGDDALFGGAGRDRLAGGAGDDTLNGAGGQDRELGGGGDDMLLGGGGGDRMIGGAGADTLSGGGGGDMLRGGLGADLLIGGSGADRFAFTMQDGANVIADFSQDQGDRIAISGGLGFGDLDIGAVAAGVRIEAGDLVILLRGFAALPTSGLDAGRGDKGDSFLGLTADDFLF